MTFRPTKRGRRIIMSRKAVEQLADWMLAVSQTLSRTTPANAVHTCAGVRFGMGSYEHQLRAHLAAKPKPAKKCNCNRVGLVASRCGMGMTPCVNEKCKRSIAYTPPAKKPAKKGTKPPARAGKGAKK